MMDALYQNAIMARAKEAVGAGTLEDADATVTVHNPLCGDRVTMEIRITDGKVAAVAHEVRGCVLCQAAASVVAANAPGTDAAALSALRDEIGAMLKEGAELRPRVWDDLAMFTPVAAHKNRHECVLLPFEALRRAIEEAERP